jgi:hypothetical protein
MRAGSVVFLLACAPPLRLEVEVYSACNQAVIDSSEYIELRVFDWGTGGTLVAREIWTRAAGKGELPGVPPTAVASVEVVARASDAAGDPSTAVAAHTAAYLDLSGSDGADSASLQVSLGRINTFATTTQIGAQVACSALGLARVGHTVTALQGGTVLISGGVVVAPDGMATATPTTEVFSPVTGGFVTGPQMQWSRTGHTATLLADGRVLVAGGAQTMDTGEMDALFFAQLFAADGASIERTLQMKTSRMDHTATLLGDGRVLLIGGRVGSTSLTSTEIYDPANGSGLLGPTLKVARAFHAAVRIGERSVLVIGGRGGGQVLDSIELVQVDQALSEEVATLTFARSHAVAAAVDAASVVVAGGLGNVPVAPALGLGLGSVELIKVTAGAVSAVLPCGQTLLQPRGGAAMARLGERLLLAGGVDADGVLLSDAEILAVDDPDACLLSLSASEGQMAQARAFGVATELPGSPDVLVVGGQSSGGASAVGELYVDRR